MPLIPDTWTGKLDKGDPFSGPDLASWLTAFATVINLLDATNFPASGAGIPILDLDTGLLQHTGGVSKGIKVLYGTATVAVNTAKVGTLAVVFDTDCDLAPGGSFKAATTPRVYASVVEDTGGTDFLTTGNPMRASAINITVTGFDCQVGSPTATGGATNYTVHWIAVGEVP